MKFFSTLCVCLFISFTLSVGFAEATDLPRILVVGEDVDTDTIERGTRVFKRVQNGMINAMLNQGFDVKDETVLTYETHTQGRTRRNDQELIEIAKDTGIDILVIFSIYPNAHQRTTNLKVTTRIEGRMLSVNDGSRLGNFEFEPQREQLLKKPYSRNDIIEGVGKIAKVVGEEVGDYLASRLSNYSKQGPDGRGGRLQEWTLVFDGFSLDEMTEMEKILEIFSGYAGHRPSNGMKTNRHHEYWYKSSINSAKLEQNLHKLLKKFNHQGRIYMSGLKVEIKKDPKPIQQSQVKSDEW